MNSNLPSTLPNLGPKSDAMLAAIGILTYTDLQAVGAINAFITLKQVGQPVTLNLLWALEGALCNRHWRDIAKHERLRLLTELEQRGVKL